MTSTARRGRTAPSGSCSASSPTRTRRTTPSRRARSTSPTSRRHVPRRRSRTGAPRSTSTILGSYHYNINFRDPRIGGDENLLLRQAISMAIDREAINEAVYNGSAHGLDGDHAAGDPRLRREPVRLLRLRPRGRPGGVRRVAGRRQRAAGDPDPVQRRCRPRAGGGDLHRQPGGDRHRGRGRPADHGDLLLRDRRRGVRDLPCRMDHGLPDVRQLHVRPVPHRFDRRQQLRLHHPEFDAVVDEAKATTDPEPQAQLFQQAEQILLNEEVGGDPDQLVPRRLRLQPRDPRRTSGTVAVRLIPWEQITVTK